MAIHETYPALRQGGRVAFRTAAPAEATGDVELAVGLLPAMHERRPLTIERPVSRELLRRQREYQRLQALWSDEWTHLAAPLEEVDVTAPVATDRDHPPGRGVGAFFSGGVDSWATVLDNDDLTHLVFVRGADLAVSDRLLGDEVEERLRASAAALRLELVVVETNIRELSDRHVPWGIYHGAALYAIGLLLEPLLERVLITGAADYATAPRYGPHPLTDRLWSTRGLEIAHAGGRTNRVERTAAIAADPRVADSLRVCWENRDGAYNCGRCRKCLMTMVTLEALGMRERIATFPDGLDLEALDGIVLPDPMLVTFWQDILDLIAASDRTDLRAAVEPLVERNRAALGLPPGWRLRVPATATVPVAERDRLAARLETVVGSRSWRLTAPARRAAAAVRRMRSPQPPDGPRP